MIIPNPTSAGWLDPEESGTLVICAHPLLRAGVKTALKEVPWIRICGEAGTASMARSLRDETMARFAVLDFEMPSAHALSRDFTREKRATHVVVLSAREDLESVQRAFQAGASAYVSKEDPVFEIGRALNMIVAGERFLSHRLEQSLMRLATNGRSTAADVSGIRSLSGREQEVFRLLGEGAGPSAIAQGLGISVKTVETHVRRAQEKLGVRGVEQLRRAASQWMRSNGEWGSTE